MGSNAARSVPIISWHRPAQRHLVPDLGAAAALPHEKKVGLGLISHPILLLTVCMVPYTKGGCACVSVSVCPPQMVDIHHREKSETTFTLHVRLTAAAAEGLGDRQ